MAFRSFGAAGALPLTAVLIGSTFTSPVLAQESAPPATSSTAPPASQAKEKGEADDGPGSGLYVDLDGAAMFAFSSSHEWKDDCPAATIDSETWAPECSTRAPIGVLADGRIGY